MFRPSAAVRVNLPDDTEALTPVEEFCALIAAANAPFESFVETVTAPILTPFTNKSPDANVAALTEFVKVSALDSTVALTEVVDLIPLTDEAFAIDEDWPL